VFELEPCDAEPVVAIGIRRPARQCREDEYVDVVYAHPDDVNIARSPSIADELAAMWRAALQWSGKLLASAQARVPLMPGLA
jgi:hypothetical protein